MYNDPLPDPANIHNSASHDAPPKPVNTRRNLDRPTPTSDPFHVVNLRTNDAEYPSPHRFNFR
jgi:hypothetical protein